MEESILTTTKKNLGVAEEITDFDLDIITHINSTFSHLTQIGVGPPEGFMIEDKDSDWSDFIGEGLEYISVKTYVFLKVKLAFDPPNTSFALDAIKDQIQEYEVRLNINSEDKNWVSPENISA